MSVVCGVDTGADGVPGDSAFVLMSVLSCVGNDISITGAEWVDVGARRCRQEGDTSS